MKFGRKLLLFFALLVVLASPWATQLAGDDDIIVPNNFIVAGDDDIIVPNSSIQSDNYAAAAGDDDIIVPNSYYRITLV